MADRYLLQVLAHQQGQLFLGRGGNLLAIGEDRMGKRRSTFAVPLLQGGTHRLPHNLLGIFHVTGKIVEDLRNGDGIVIGVPAIVVCDHGQHGIADFRFARQLGFLEAGHPDDVHAPRPVKVRFRLGGKRRAFHAQVRPTLVKRHVEAGTRFREHVHNRGTNGRIEPDVRHQPTPEKSGDALARAVNKLRGQRHIRRVEILTQRAHRAH